MTRFKILLLSLFFGVSPLLLNSQVTIKGVIQDTTNVTVPAATVMLLNSADSALINYTTSNQVGEFSFKNVKNIDYILKISHVTYMPWQKHIKQSEAKEIDLGVITMYPIADFLMEIVIRDAKAPIFIRGDTVEYDASTFKVPPGSTVEDLLRRLPGIDVDANGNISTMGKDIKAVYVDGKTFFGDDPTTVTQNLDAEAVSKVKVYSETSEQERLTGISGGEANKDKVLNLELKDEYKKGYFGKATVAYGTSDRWAARGNFNWFNDKQQLSFIGYGNNINQTGVNWSDYSEFKGQSMSNRYDNGDFGFNSGGGGGRVFYYGNNDYFDGNGFTENYGGGVNYNYFNKKIKLNAGYFGKRNDLFSDQFSNRQTFLTDSVYNRLDTLHNFTRRDNHVLSTRVEYEPDSNNTIIARANFDFTSSDRSRNQYQLYQTSDYNDINLNTINNSFDISNLNFNALAIYRHKFKKKGRNFAISSSYDIQNDDNIENIYNENIFYNRLIYLDAQGPAGQIINLVNNNGTDYQQIKSSVLYVEPLSKRFSLLGFYNFRTENRESDNFSRNPFSVQLIDSLKLNYQNNVLYNRAGASLSYGYEGINISLGGAFQSMQFKGISKTYLENKEETFVYNNFVPYLTADVEITDNIYFNGEYTYNITEPDMMYLFPMPNLTNQLYVTLGNPELNPTRYHEVSSYISYWNNANMVNISLSAYDYIYDSRIVYNQITEFVDTVGYVTTYKPENVKGGNDFGVHIWSNFPIIKTKLTMSVNPSFRNSKSPVYINGIENITNSKTYSGRIGFSLTLGPKLSFSINGNVSSTDVDYSIQNEQNQQYMNYSSSAGLKWQVFQKTFLEGNFNFTNYNNKSFDFNRNIQTLNLSVRQVIGKKNKFEARLAAFDLLNQNQYVRQYAGGNYVEYITSPTLARYFMLSVSYNLRGFDTSNQRRGYM